ncbi:MAG TPA: tetratricopeptide repeat protein [Gammaproteobacteria bacterium]|jgi:TPR repeat protein|nr:tetratricopeptide repeat protein [Gammaproteobacteria bacterium]
MSKSRPKTRQDLLNEVAKEVIRDSEKSKQMHQLAEKGDVERQFQLGCVYAYMEHSTKDEVKAARYFLLAANQGHVIAQNNLGLLYSEGFGVPKVKDQKKALSLFDQAAAQGYPLAQYNLANMYQEGKSIPKNEREAARLFYLVATSQHKDATKEVKDEAQEDLKTMYKKIKGINHRFYQKKSTLFYATLFFKDESMKQQFNRLAKYRAQKFLALLHNHPETWEIAEGLLEKDVLEKIKNEWIKFHAEVLLPIHGVLLEKEIPKVLSFIILNYYQDEYINFENVMQEMLRLNLPDKTTQNRKT